MDQDSSGALSTTLLITKNFLICRTLYASVALSGLMPSGDRDLCRLSVEA